MKNAKELSEKELQETNGGNSTSASQSGLLGSFGIDNLASGSSSSHNGDQSKSSSFSIGNGITGDLGGILDGGSRTV
jgi:bacteriocin-like protein